MSVLIKGGRIVTAADDYVGDVYVENETVTLIGESLDVRGRQGDRRDGKDRHARRDRPAHPSRDGVRGHRRPATTSRRAPCRRRSAGRRRLIDFCMQYPGESFAQALAQLAREDRAGEAGHRRRLPHRRSPICTRGGSLEELAKLPDEGVTSYKLFMAYKGAVMVDDETLFRTMQVARETGALVMVHAENGDAIDVLVKEAIAEGKTDPIWHARTRPPITEGEATNRAIQLARVAGAPLYVVHVSCKEAIDPIARARSATTGRRGARRARSTCSSTRRRSSSRLRGREVRLHAAAATEGEPGAPLARALDRTFSRSSRPTTARSTGTARRRSARTTSRRSRTAARGSRTGCTCSTTSASRDGPLLA